MDNNSELQFAIITGIISSVLTIAIVSCLRRIRDYILYRKSAGSYVVHHLDGKIEKNEIITLCYVGNKQFRATSNKYCQEYWSSDIVMDSINKYHGEGIYIHSGNEGFGIHDILINQKESTVLVHYRALSNNNGIYGGLMWKKI